MELNGYRIMWIMVFFDLPVTTKADRKRYAKFRKDLIEDGFIMFQFSIYVRHCTSRENRDVHYKRVKRFLPQKGQVGIFSITDKQFETIELFTNNSTKKPPPENQQLTIFDFDKN